MPVALVFDCNQNMTPYTYPVNLTPCKAVRYPTYTDRLIRTLVSSDSPYRNAGEVNSMPSFSDDVSVNWIYLSLQQEYNSRTGRFSNVEYLLLIL